MNVSKTLGSSLVVLLAGCHEVGRYRASAVLPIAANDAMANDAMASDASQAIARDAGKDAGTPPPSQDVDALSSSAARYDAAVETNTPKTIGDAAGSTSIATSTMGWSTAERTVDAWATAEPSRATCASDGGIGSDCDARADCGWAPLTPDGLTCTTGGRFRQVGTQERDYADFLTVASDGSLWLLGTTDGKFPGQPQGSGDPFIRGWSTDGTHLWTKQFVADETLYSSGIASTANGSLVVALQGWGNAEVPGRVHLQALTATGGTTWLATIDGEYDVELGTIAARPGGGVYVCVWEQASESVDDAGILPGVFVVYHFDESGNLEWSRELPAIQRAAFTLEIDGKGIAVWPDGSLVVIGTSYTTMETFPFGGTVKLTKLEQDGNVSWQKLIDGAEIGTQVAVDPSGNIIFGSKAGRDGVVHKRTSEGEPLWEVTLGSMNENHPTVAADADGNIFAVMTTDVTLSDVGYDGFTSHFGGTDVLAARLSPSGETLWAKQFGTEQEDHAMGVTWSSGFAYAYGYTYGSFDGSDPESAYDTDAFVVQLVP